MRQIVTARGDPVDIKLYAVTVAKVPYPRNGKTYVGLDVGSALGDVDVLSAVDEFVAKAARPTFSPVQGARVLAKMVHTKYETDAGAPGFEFPLQEGMLLDVVLRPGAFGEFGYCLLVHRVKPHAPKPAKPHAP